LHHSLQPTLALKFNLVNLTLYRKELKPGPLSTSIRHLQLMSVVLTKLYGLIKLLISQ
jgi:hypothetical protein